MYIGGHVSVAGGLTNGITKAKEIGANTIQIFGSSPRQWQVRMPQPEAAEAFREEVKAEKMGPVFLHAPYLINLASPNAEARKKSLDCLIGHFHISELVGAKGLILHIGSGSEMPKDKSFEVVVELLQRAINAVEGKSQLLVENSAGGGGKIGSSLAEVGEILDAVRSDRIGACYDTAHGFEAGIIENYSEAGVEALAKEMGRTIGWQRLAALHVNDSKTKFNSHHDRHENIGDGYIGLDGFRSLMANKKFRSAPWLLEVPGIADEGPDKHNVDILKRLAVEVDV